jgi:MFS transporter, DHA1 family, multidrug resistance protein
MWKRLVDKAYFALFLEYPQLKALTVVTLAAQLAAGLISFYALPKYLFEHWGLTGEQVGLVGSTFLISETLCKIPLGRISDRVGRRPLITLSTLCIILNPIFIISLPVTMWKLIFPIRAVDGAGAAALWPPLYAAVGDSTRGRSRAAAMGMINTVYIAAIGVAAALGGFTIELAHGNDRAPFYVASGLLLLSTFVSYFGLRPAAIDSHGEEAEHEEAEAEQEGECCGPQYSLPLVLVLSFLIMFGPLIIAYYIAAYLQGNLGLSNVGISKLLLVMGIPILALGPPLGRIADRCGTSRAVRLSVLVAAGLMWLLPSCQTVPSFALVATGIVLILMFGAPAWLALVSSLAQRRWRGGMMATVATAEGCGAALGPYVGGRLWDLHHSYIFYGAGTALTLAAVVALISLRPLRARE